MRISTGILLSVAALSLAACSSDPGTRALEGGGIGAAVGAVGTAIVGGPRLPWNPRKTWSGLTAFVLWGGVAAAFLIRWTQMAVIDELLHGFHRLVNRVSRARKVDLI